MRRSAAWRGRSNTKWVDTRNRGRGCDPGCGWTSVVRGVGRLRKGNLDWVVSRTGWTSPDVDESSWVVEEIPVWTRRVFTLVPTIYSPVMIKRLVEIKAVVESFTLKRIGRVSGRHFVYLDRNKNKSIYKRKIASVGDFHEARDDRF